MILGSEVDLSKGCTFTDFGRGFYTTTDLETARVWSEGLARRRQEEAAVIELQLNRESLSHLGSIVSLRGTLDARDYRTFVASCRLGYSHDPTTGSFYDVAYGPVATRWLGSDDSAVWAGYDQVSFHTRDAQDMLNDESQCTMQEAT